MRASLEIEAGDGFPSWYELPPDRPATLGRHRENTIVLRDRHASRRHAEVVPESGRWLLRNLSTTNGTKLDGQRILEPAVLRDGQAVGIGDTILRFRCEHGEETVPPEVLPAEPEQGPESSSFPPTLL
jgi:pSer/pThr/pTyr-binding forkhead associated (FHA) protein